MNTPMISVIVPVYNAESMIENCVRSILANSVSLELILVDDGSPDNSGAVCDQLAAGDLRIRVLHKENGGVGSARNAGLALATGTYLAFVDADDAVSADMYGIMVKKAEETGADCVVCNIVNRYAFRKISERHVFGKQVVASSAQIHDRIVIPLITPGHGDAVSLQSPCNKLYRRALVRKYDLQFSYLPYAEDWMFNIEFFMNSSVVAFVEEELYFYNRATEGSLSKSWRKDSFSDSVWVQNKLALLFPERYSAEDLKLGVLGIQEECLRNYAHFCGGKGFFAYALQLFSNEELVDAYHAILQLPARYRFPKKYIQNGWRMMYCLWAINLTKMTMVKYYVRRIMKRQER